MPIAQALFSSHTCEWSTPQWLFDQINNKYHFTLDVCATAQNAKCTNYYTVEQDGLTQDWQGVVWCNPPYGKGKINKWVKKAYDSAKNGAIVVMLLPARTDTRWFHDYIYNQAHIYFLKGRLKFGGSKNSAPFPSMLVVFGNAQNCEPGNTLTLDNS